MNNDRFLHRALRAADPDEMRLVRSSRPGAVTLVTADAGQKNAVLESLPDGRTEAACIRHDETSYWLVQTPTEEARRALRRLGWAEVPRPNNSTKGRSEPAMSRREKGETRRERGPASQGNFRSCWRRRGKRDG